MKPAANLRGMVFLTNHSPVRASDRFSTHQYLPYPDDAAKSRPCSASSTLRTGTGWITRGAARLRNSSMQVTALKLTQFLARTSHESKAR
jgi:hypothetical protein